jgi:hypothetical protein
MQAYSVPCSSHDFDARLRSAHDLDIIRLRSAHDFDTRLRSAHDLHSMQNIETIPQDRSEIVIKRRASDVDSAELLQVRVHKKIKFSDDCTPADKKNDSN